jgi:fructokinase
LGFSGELEKLINVFRWSGKLKKDRPRQIKALTFGEALFDIIKGVPLLGGAPFNLAAHLAKLGAKPAVITAIGKDELGNILLSRAKNLGIETSYILIDEKRPTGTVNVELKAEGIPVFTINEGVAWDAIIVDDERFNSLKNQEWDVFCFGTLAQRSKDNRKTLQILLRQIKAKHFFYDLNLRTGFYKEKWILASLEHSTILKMNEEEALFISNLLFNTKLTQSNSQDYKALCQLIVGKYPDIAIICITKGPDGAAVYYNETNNEVNINNGIYNGIYEEIKTVPVDVEDTVGAGDAFSAGFLYAYFSGLGISKAASIASILGTFVASKPGSVPDYSPELISKLKAEGLDLD